MIAYHFRLQAKRIHRMVCSMGLHPLVNYSIILALFGAVSFSLFSHRTKILVAYVFIAFQVLSLQSKPAYHNFLKQLYTRSDLYRIRILENLLIALPFSLMLLVSAYYYVALGVLLVSLVMALSTQRLEWQIVLPTPFYRHPFEFTAGFRMSFLLVLGGYYLTYISIHHVNPGIGIFVIYVLGILAALYHSYPEDLHYVWIFSCRAARFLQYKLLIAWGYTTLLSIPALLPLALAFPDSLGLILTAYGLGLAVAATGVLCKYAAFPQEISLREGLPLMFAIMFPPFLLFLLPYFYLTALRRLKEILL
jgi:hypothetical protein